MPFRSRKFARSAGRQARRRFKKRYVQRRGGVRYGKLARDVQRIKYALNSETKFIDTLLSLPAPTASSPSIQALDTPDTQGVGLTNRVGSKVKFCHLSARLVVQHQNFGNVRSSQNLTFHILFLKNGMFSSDFETAPGQYLLNPDFNGDYTRMSYWNQQNYPSFLSVYRGEVNMKDTQPPSQSAYGLATDTDGVNTETQLGRQPQTQSRYIDINKRITIHTEWANIYNVTPGFNTDDITAMKPYIFVTTDCTSQAVPAGAGQPTGTDTDRMFIQGSIRLSYKDN